MAGSISPSTPSNISTNFYKVLKGRLQNLSTSDRILRFSNSSRSFPFSSPKLAAYSKDRILMLERLRKDRSSFERWLTMKWQASISYTKFPNVYSRVLYVLFGWHFYKLWKISFKMFKHAPLPRNTERMSFTLPPCWFKRVCTRVLIWKWIKNSDYAVEIYWYFGSLTLEKVWIRRHDGWLSNFLGLLLLMLCQH